MIGYIAGALAFLGLARSTPKRTIRRRGRIGQTYEPWKNPLTPPPTEKEIKKDPRYLLHPRISSRLLFAYVDEYPFYVKSNHAALHRLMSEDKSKYETLQGRIERALLSGDILPFEEHMRLSLLFAERVASLYSEFARDSLFDDMIDACVDYLNKEISEQEAQRRFYLAADLIHKKHGSPSNLGDDPSPETKAAASAVYAMLFTAKGLFAGKPYRSMFDTFWPGWSYAAKAVSDLIDRSDYSDSEAGASLYWKDKQQAMAEERKWQADQVEIAYEEYLREKERSKAREDRAKEIYTKTLEELEATRFREAFYGEEADKAWAERAKTEAKIKKAVARAKSDAQKVATMMATVEEDENSDEWGWPEWLGAGIVAGGAALLIGPEVIAALAARAGATYAAETIASIAARWGITRVAINMEGIEAALISARGVLARASTLESEGAALRAEAELSSLVSKLRAADFEVMLEKAAEVVVRVAR